MTETQMVSATIAILTAGLLLGLLIAVRDYRLDEFRDRLFAMRDEMFLYALDEGLVDSPAHRNLRELMNSLLRYAHQISLLRLVLLDVARRFARIEVSMPASYMQWVATVNALPPAQRAKFRQFHADAMMLVMKHMVTGSPSLLTVGAVVAIYFRVVRSTKMLFDVTADALRRRVPSLDLFEADALRTAHSH